MTISQYSNVAQYEQLEDILDAHTAGMLEKLPSGSSAPWTRAHILSLVTKGNIHTIFEAELTNADNSAILDALRTGIGNILEPEFDPDIIVGAGSTVTLD